AIWPWAVALGFYLIWRHHLHMVQLYAWPNFTEHCLGVATFLRSVLTHLRLLILPIGLHFDRSQRLFLSFTDVEFLMTMFIWVVLLTWLCICRRKIEPLIWFCIIWVALELLPISQLLTSIGVSPGMISSADHFLYLVSVPVFIIFVKIVSGIKKIGSL